MPKPLAFTIKERCNAGQEFIPASGLDGGPFQSQTTTSYRGKKYQLLEEDEYPMGTPGWWAAPEEMMSNANSGWPSSMKCSFIEPGIVNYADVGMVYVRKETLDKMANSMIGKPVVNEDHRDVSPDEFSKGTAQGIINSVWYEPTDGKFHAAYQIWDQPTLKNIKDGYKVSCAYKVTRWGAAGVHNNVPYDREVLDGEYTHLAIVANPRYEDVRIYNAKGAKKMTLTWIKKLLGADGKQVENSLDIDSSKSVLEIDGKNYSLDNAITALKEQEAKKAEELANKGPADDDMIDIGGGQKRSVKELKAAVALKNEMDDDEKKKKKDDEDKKENERKNAAEKAELENAHKAGKHPEGKAAENCAMCNEIKNKAGRDHFERVDHLANNRKGDIDDLVNELPPFYDGFAEGRKRFGSEPVAAK